MALALFDHGAQRLQEFVRPGVLCAFDFDGTLAPIVTLPDKAAMPAGLSRRLGTLTRLTPTAIITGRSLADIRARVDFHPTFLVGNHGLEGVPGWEGRAAEHARRCAEWQARLAPALAEASRFDAGIQIEDKHYSLSVHYRLARDRTRAEALLPALFAEVLPEARVVAGKCVFNLLPDAPLDKGIALQQLMTLCDAPAALYVGDDVTDEDVFRRQDERLLTVRIGNARDSAAEFFIAHRLQMVQLLDTLLAGLQRLRPPLSEGSRRTG